MKLKRGDNVMVISGNNKGKTGIIDKILTVQGRVIIGGVNVVKKHIKPSNTSKQSGIVEKSLPIDMSNILIICSNCKKSTKIKYIVKQKEKRRICSKCKETI